MKLKTIMRPRNPKNFNEINLVLEYCEQNLSNVIRLNKTSLTTGHIKLFTYQIVKGLLFMHSKGVIHRDLKPLNILVYKGKCLKISDFGHSNVKTDKINKDYNLTSQISTR